MRILRGGDLPFHRQPVKFFNIKVKVYHTAKYMAVNASGVLCWFNNRPTPCDDGVWRAVGESTLEGVAVVDLEGVNWTDTLCMIIGNEARLLRGPAPKIEAQIAFKDEEIKQLKAELTQKDEEVKELRNILGGTIMANRKPQIKIVRKVFDVKAVNYFGTELVVPTHIKYLATNSTGRLWGFTEKPKLNINFTEWLSAGLVSPRYVADLDLDGHHWTESLLEIK